MHLLIPGVLSTSWRGPIFTWYLIKTSNPTGSLWTLECIRQDRTRTTHHQNQDSGVLLCSINTPRPSIGGQTTSNYVQKISSCPWESSSSALVTDESFIEGNGAAGGASAAPPYGRCISVGHPRIITPYLSSHQPPSGCDLLGHPREKEESPLMYFSFPHVLIILPVPLPFSLPPLPLQVNLCAQYYT